MLPLALRPGKEKEASARSCHQEVLRQCKAAWAGAAAAAAAAAAKPAEASPAAAAASSSSSSSDQPAETSSTPASEPTAANGAEAPAPVESAVARVPSDLMPGANGYLAAGELALQLKLPGLAVKLLDLAAGE